MQRQVGKLVVGVGAVERFESERDAMMKPRATGAAKRSWSGWATGASCGSSEAQKPARMEGHPSTQFKRSINGGLLVMDSTATLPPGLIRTK